MSLNKLKDYDNGISDIKEILKGNISKSIKEFKKKMIEFSNKEMYEEAQKIKDKIDLLDNYQHKSTVVSSKLNNIDVFSIVSDSESAFVNYLQISFGRVIRFHNQEIKKRLDETDEEILSHLIINLREKYSSNSKTIICQFN